MEEEFTVIDYLKQYSGLNLFFRAEYFIRKKHPKLNEIVKFVLEKEANSGLFL